MVTLETLGAQAKTASRVLMTAPAAAKNNALLKIADALIQNTDSILAENEKDLAAGRANGMADSLLDRLALSAERIAGMAQGVREVADLPDPIGTVQSEITRPNGLTIQRVSVPLGVIAVIFEARPNVTSDAAALCLKAGSACLCAAAKRRFIPTPRLPRLCETPFGKRNSPPTAYSLWKIPRGKAQPH